MPLLAVVPAGAQQPAIVKDISLVREGPDYQLTVTLTSPTSFATFRLADPHRIVLDIADADLPERTKRIEGGAGILGVRASQYSQEPRSVRVVIDLAEPMSYRTVSRSPSEQIVLRVLSAGPVSEPATAPGEAAQPLTRPVLPSPPPADRIPLPPGARGLAQIVHSVLPDGTERVTLVLERRCAYHTFVLSDPPRICLDLDGVTEGLGQSQEPYTSRPAQPAAVSRVRAMRVLGYPPLTRVLIDIPSLLPYQVHSWYGPAFYLTVDIPPRVESRAGVVIDAGHGGSEPGACGGHYAEKQLNLDMALKLQRELIARGIVALLTRSEDTDVGLFERAWYANEAGADLFVSIHCNAQPGYAQGTSVWYTHDASAELAQLAQLSLLSGLGRPDKGVRTARFVVTREAEMAAILCEIAYIDDPEEEKLLGTPEFQERAARGIAVAVRQYVAAQRTAIARGPGGEPIP